MDVTFCPETCHIHAHGWCHLVILTFILDLSCAVIFIWTLVARCVCGGSGDQRHSRQCTGGSTVPHL